MSGSGGLLGPCCDQNFEQPVVAVTLLPSSSVPTHSIVLLRDMYVRRLLLPVLGSIPGLVHDEGTTFGCLDWL